eukprot:11157073-Lingulodinium_polyedra.AAC.1
MADKLLALCWCWLAEVLERLPPLTIGSADPTDAPILRANKRARAIDPGLKARIVEMAGHKGLATSIDKALAIHR